MRPDLATRTTGLQCVRLRSSSCTAQDLADVCTRTPIHRVPEAIAAAASRWSVKQCAFSHKPNAPVAPESTCFAAGAFCSVLSLGPKRNGPSRKLSQLSCAFASMVARTARLPGHSIAVWLLCLAPQLRPTPDCTSFRSAKLCSERLNINSWHARPKIATAGQNESSTTCPRRESQPSTKG